MRGSHASRSDASVQILRLQGFRKADGQNVCADPLNVKLAPREQDPAEHRADASRPGARDDDADQPPALVVEDLPETATSAAG